MPDVVVEVMLVEAVQQKMMEVVLELYSVMSSVQRTTRTYVVHR